MKRLVTCLCFGLVTLLATSASAQRRDETHVADEAVSTGQPRMTYAQRIIHQRALQSARHRLARMQTRHWLGQSLLRPAVPPGFYVGGRYHYHWRPYHGYYGPIRM